MVGFAVMGTPFTICHHFVTHVLLLFPPPHCSRKNIVNCGTGKKKKNGDRNVLKETLLKIVERMPTLTFPKHLSTNHKNSKILIVQVKTR